MPQICFFKDIPLLRKPLVPRGLLLAVLLTGPSAAAAQQDLPDITITHQARALQPGEAVLISVASAIPLRSVSGRFLGTEVAFYPTHDASHWEGLVGLDLEIQPGDHAVEITLTDPGGQTHPATYSLRVADKKFRTRTLRVRPEYVEPPPEVLERIGRESRRMKEMFSTASPERLWSGGFLRPVPGEATSSFGVRSVFNGEPRSPHSGADFRAREGTPVESPNAGRVVLAEDLYFSGNCVILDHGQGLYSFFAHLSRIGVEEGEMVSAGDAVGDVGSTGRVTGPHLHWTVRLHEARVDPLSLMELPLDAAGR